MRDRIRCGACVLLVNGEGGESERANLLSRGPGRPCGSGRGMQVSAIQDRAYFERGSRGSVRLFPLLHARQAQSLRKSDAQLESTYRPIPKSSRSGRSDVFARAGLSRSRYRHSRDGANGRNGAHGERRNPGRRIRPEWVLMRRRGSNLVEGGEQAGDVFLGPVVAPPVSCMAIDFIEAISPTSLDTNGGHEFRLDSAQSPWSRRAVDTTPPAPRRHGSVLPSADRRLQPQPIPCHAGSRHDVFTDVLV